MDVSVIVTFACAVLAAAGTGVLVGRCIRAPRMDIIAWAGAVASIAVSLGAQALGAHNGYSSGTFRAVQVGAQLIAPLWLAWGMVELAARSIAARFGAKLIAAALTVVGAVVLITDPLATTPFGKSWPIGSAHYQIIPRSVLGLIAGMTVLTVVITLVTALVRLRNDPGWRRPLLALAAAGVAAVAILGLRLSLPANLAYPALCAVCAVLASFAGLTAVKVRLDALHDEDYERYEEIDEPEGWGAHPAAVRPAEPAAAKAFGADYPQRTENGASQQLGAGAGQQFGAGAGQQFGEEDWYGLGRRNESNGGFAGYRQDGGFGMNGRENGDRDYRQDADPPVNDETSGLSDADRTGVWQPRTLGRPGGLGPGGTGGPGGLGPGGLGAGAAGGAAAGLGAAGLDAVGRGAAGRGGQGARGGGVEAEPDSVDRDATQRLFGLIAIYTLAEGCDEEFDALAERVVEEVRASEPDALVYAVHSVPNAPMQRIFYEVYRDQTAFEEHKRHSYIKRFDVERAPFVLATNVIELGTQQAKLSPLPGLSQLFGHTPGD
ncbi:MAG TPA: antibiotic biosynthesis monooxygenase [Streptosporangiaceae bacterium]|jgi:quinol monooxygenase YgiN|nr:antibiotic biosynthesis monooxygenase [Streptosporangiaceae bacterium]